MKFICSFNEVMDKEDYIACIILTASLKLHRHWSCSSTDEGRKCDYSDYSKTNEVTAQDVAMNPGKTNKRGSTKAWALNLDNMGDRIVQTSCPTKKRIQVPQYPSFNAPTSSMNAKCGSALVDVNKAEISSATKNQQTTVNENEEASFQPFFWLREEEDAEQVTQYSDKDQLTDISPPEVPCFSDIKDSDDDVAVNSAAVVCIKAANI